MGEEQYRIANVTAALKFCELRITNYKAYRGTHTLCLDNPAGLYYLRGVNQVNPDLDSNQVGKSSLMDAITWCLYGKTLRDEKPGASVEPWTGEKETEVALCIERHDRSHTIVRGRRPNKLLLSRDDNPPVECSQQDIDMLVGMSYTVFICAVILPQFGERFLDMRPEEQSRLFSETLDYDLWLRASEVASAKARASQEEIRVFENRRESTQGRITLMENRQARDIQASKEFATERAQRMRAKATELKAAESAIAGLEARAAPLGVPTEAQIQGVVDVIAGLRVKLRDVERMATEANAIVVQANTDLDGNELALIALDANPKICPACGQLAPVGHYRKERARLKIEADEAQHRHDEAYSIWVVVSEEGRRFAEQIDVREHALVIGRLRMRQAQADEDACANQISNSRQTCDRLKREIQELRSQHNPYGAIVDKAARDIEEAHAQLLGDEDKIADESWLKQAYEYWAESYRQIRLNLIDDLLQSLEQSTNQHAEELGLYGWRIEFATEKETTAGKISRGFSTFLYPPGHVEPVRWRAFCGVEVQIWQLAVRFALAEMLLGHAGLETNIEFLDECTQHLSPGVVDRLLLCLTERATRLGRQTVLVEHHVFDEGQFAGVITITHDVAGSRIATSW